MFKGRVLQGQRERCSSARPSVAQTDQGKSSTKANGQHGYSSAKQRGRPKARQRPAVNPACFVEHVRGTRVRELAWFASHIDREPPFSNKTSVKQSQQMSLT